MLRLKLSFLAPGPVQQLTISETGPTHVRLSWQRPLEPNGVLTRYLIGYKSCELSAYKHLHISAHKIDQ